MAALLSGLARVLGTRQDTWVLSYQCLVTHGAVRQRHMGRLLISHMSNAAPRPRADTRLGTEDAPGSVCRSLILSGYWLRFHLLSPKTDSTIISQVRTQEPSARHTGVGERHPPPTDRGEGSSGALSGRTSSPQPRVFIPSNPTGQEDLGTGCLWPGSGGGRGCSPWTLRAGSHLYSAHK